MRATRLGVKTWAIVDLDFLWNGAGKVLGSDILLSQFCEKLDQIAGPRPTSTNESERRKNKALRVQACRVQLKSDVERLVESLSKHSIYVLPNGEIEDYFGMGEGSKHQYLEVAGEVARGERAVKSPNDLIRIFDVLKGWTLESHA